MSLSGDPTNEAAVEEARRIKGYREARPFVCLVPDGDTARALSREWPSAAELLAAAFWPGPLTLVVPASDAAPPAVVGDGSIAVRPAVDTVSTALLSAWRRPLFSTSANRRGEDPPTDVTTALSELAGAGGGVGTGSGMIEVALVPLIRIEAAGRPSTIVDVGSDPPRLLRDGAVPAAWIREVIGALVEGSG